MGGVCVSGALPGDATAAETRLAHQQHRVNAAAATAAALQVQLEEAARVGSKLKGGCRKQTNITSN